MGEPRDTAVGLFWASATEVHWLHFVADTIFVNYVISEFPDGKSRREQAIARFDIAVVDQNECTVQRGTKALLLSKEPLAAVAAGAMVKRSMCGGKIQQHLESTARPILSGSESARDGVCEAAAFIPSRTTSPEDRLRPAHSSGRVLPRRTLRRPATRLRNRNADQP
jgi:hypothetical protein